MGLRRNSGATRAAIRGNAIRSAILVAGFPFVLPILASIIVFTTFCSLHERQAGPWAVDTFVGSLIGMIALTVVWLPIGYFSHQWVIDRATNARLLSRSEEPRVWAIFERLCASCGMRLPALRIIEVDALNAFASGLRDGAYSVTVTRGLLLALDDDELETVLAHELTHIRNSDVRLLVVAIVMVGMIPLLHDIVLKTVWAMIMGLLKLYRAILSFMPLARALAELSYTLTFWICQLTLYAVGIVGKTCSLVIHFALSRKREFMADAGAVDMTGKPYALISALRRIGGQSRLDLAVDGMQAMLFDSSGMPLAWLFATHPPIEARIAAIQRLTDDGPMAAQEVLIPVDARTPPSPVVEQPQSDLVEPTPGPFRPVAVARYRAALLSVHPETMDLASRQALYARARTALENNIIGIEPSIVHGKLLDLEAAIAQVEDDTKRLQRARTASVRQEPQAD